MDAGVPGVEFKTHGRIASAVRKIRRNRATRAQNRLFRAVSARFHQFYRLKPDRLLEHSARTDKSFPLCKELSGAIPKLNDCGIP